ncbi:MAG: hypothetical protein K5622_03725 [Endomicrobiaceae bacterium]|nr:hypothetical protein [Endomicrobiaceae bacterium]
MCKIKIIGCGGSGANIVNLLEGKEKTEVYLINSDSAALKKSKVKNKILIGNGFGCGGNIEKAKEYAKNSIEEFREILKDTDIIFITTGMGGGTGSAVASVIAQLANELDIFTISIVTKPFTVEGEERTANAKVGIEELRRYSDALFVVSNDKFYPLTDSKSRYEKGFEMIDDTIRVMIDSITNILKKQDIINIDFDDILFLVRDYSKELFINKEKEENIKDISKREVFLAIGKGENVEQALENAIKNQVIEYRNNILDAGKIIINIEYNNEKDCSVRDIRTLYDKIPTLFKKYKSLKIGNNQNDKLDSKIRITILASIK